MIHTHTAKTQNDEDEVITQVRFDEHVLMTIYMITASFSNSCGGIEQLNVIAVPTITL